MALKSSMYLRRSASLVTRTLTSLIASLQRVTIVIGAQHKPSTIRVSRHDEEQGASTLWTWIGVVRAVVDEYEVRAVAAYELGHRAVARPSAVLAQENRGSKDFHVSYLLPPKISLVVSLRRSAQSVRCRL